ncbi:MAG TPA: hypothetical protein VFN99_11250 [Gaiella sp.]|nr:hypothetical protein [Gaiella sp.]
MNEHLESVRSDLDAGGVSAETLVRLFRAAEEAEEQRDEKDLEQALELAQRIVGRADAALAAEAERLLALCDERLERVRGVRHETPSSPAAGAVACAGCGRPVDSSAVRCRSCGTLLV